MKQVLGVPRLWLVIGVALGLRLVLLNGSFWLDEAAQALESARPFSQQLLIANDFQPPLIHYLVHFALYLSSAEWWLRLIAALIPGLLTIWGTYQLGKKLVNADVGLISSLLLTTSSFHIFYSQELRPYSLPTLWAVLSWLTIVTLTHPTARPPKKKWLFGAYFLLTVLGMYSSYLYPFLLMSQCLYLGLYHRAHLQAFLTTWLLTGISFLPWLPFLNTQLKIGGQWRTELPGWETVVSFTQLKSPLMVVGKFVYGVMDLEPTSFFIISGLALAGAGIYSGWRLINLQPPRTWVANLYRNRNLALLLTWLLLPFLAAWLISFWIPVIQPKRVLYLLPAMYLLIGWLSQTSKTYLLIGLLLFINLWSTWQYYTNPRLQRENWRALHAQIQERYPSHETLVVFSFDEPFAPWRWYDQGTYETFSTGSLYIENTTNLSEKLEVITEYRYIVVFDYLRDLTDPNDRLTAEIEVYGFQTMDVIDQPNIGFVRIFAQKEALLTHL